MTSSFRKELTCVTKDSKASWRRAAWSCEFIFPLGEQKWHLSSGLLPTGVLRNSGSFTRGITPMIFDFLVDTVVIMKNNESSGVSTRPGVLGL